MYLEQCQSGQRSKDTAKFLQDMCSLKQCLRHTSLYVTCLSCLVVWLHFVSYGVYMLVCTLKTTEYKR